jgi:hypothetical protein
MTKRPLGLPEDALITGHLRAHVFDSTQVKIADAGLPLYYFALAFLHARARAQHRGARNRRSLKLRLSFHSVMFNGKDFAARNH